jgi:hypothetical protein
MRPASPFGARDLLAMTSHNGCTIQRRLVLPLSASGVLRQGRFPALRSGAICCIELWDVMPSPEAGGRSRARPQNMPRCGRVTNALASWRVVLVAPPPARLRASCGRPATMPRSSRKYQPLHAVLRQAGARIERERGASIAPDPPGLITLECWPGERGRRSCVAVAAPQKTSVRRQSRPGAEESLARRRKVVVDALIAVRARDRSRELRESNERLEKKNPLLPSR